MNLIEAEGLVKKYGKVTALDGLSLKVEERARYNLEIKYRIGVIYEKAYFPRIIKLLDI